MLKYNKHWKINAVIIATSNNDVEWILYSTECIDINHVFIPTLYISDSYTITYPDS